MPTGPGDEAGKRSAGPAGPPRLEPRLGARPDRGGAQEPDALAGARRRGLGHPQQEPRVAAVLAAGPRALHPERHLAPDHSRRIREEDFRHFRRHENFAV